jgi:AcrR family transcriptional regulator
MRRVPQETGDTKQRIVDAAIATLKEEGFSATSARAIARRGDFNQALIFYHFGTLNELLVAAFDAVTTERRERYVELFDDEGPLEAKLRAAVDLYREDRDSGRIAVISEVIAGSTGNEDLAPMVAERVELWLDLTQDVLARMLDQAGLAGFVSPREAAYAVTAFFLGMDILSNVGGDVAQPEALMERAAALAPILEATLGAVPKG